jgi:dTDP-4-amino-4,6-dideoxygalactose transaminase
MGGYWLVLSSELIAAFLAAQLEQAEDITHRRLAIWDRYHAWAESLEQQGLVRRPIVPANCTHNAHMYYLLLSDLNARTYFIESMRGAGIGTVFHYVPLHSSPAGIRYGRRGSELSVTDAMSDRLVRLPLWIGIEEHLDVVMDTSQRVITRTRQH